MTENMSQMLLRGDQLNTLVDKSSNLLEAVSGLRGMQEVVGAGRAGAFSLLLLDPHLSPSLRDVSPLTAVPLCRRPSLVQSNTFQTNGKKLRSHMWCQHFKVQLIVGVGVLLLALVIFLVVCFGVAHCFAGGSPSPPPPPFPAPPTPPFPPVPSPPAPPVS